MIRGSVKSSVAIVSYSKADRGASRLGWQRVEWELQLEDGKDVEAGCWGRVGSDVT